MGKTKNRYSTKCICGQKIEIFTFGNVFKNLIVELDNCENTQEHNIKMRKLKLNKIIKWKI